LNKIAQIFPKSENSCRSKIRFTYTGTGEDVDKMTDSSMRAKLKDMTSTGTGFGQLLHKLGLDTLITKLAEVVENPNDGLPVEEDTEDQQRKRSEVHL
jgi:hypothetical protein